MPLLHRHRQRHPDRGHRHQRPRDRRAADGSGTRRRRPRDRQGRCGPGARGRWSVSSPTPTCDESSPPAAPASRRATARSKRSRALLEKRLDGFGELFRMLSFEQIGPAAMMSRACAGLVAGRIVVSLPGSEAAVRLAMERLLIRSSGTSCSRRENAVVVRPFTSTISLDEARRRLDAGACPADRAHRARGWLAETAGRVAAADVTFADRRAAVRAIGDGRLRRRRRRHRRRVAIDAGPPAACSIASTPASRRRS